MSWVRVGRQVRAIRLRSRLRQQDVAVRAGVSGSSVSLLERGEARRLAVGSVDAIATTLGARLEPRLWWNGPELERLIDAGHAALAASVKRKLERWSWSVMVEVSYNHYGERGRIDLLAWHPTIKALLVIEIKTSLVDVQQTLGTLDVKTRVAPFLAGRFGWSSRRAVPALVFLEDRTTRRRVGQLDGLFDRFALRGSAATAWARQPTVLGLPSAIPSGLLWFSALPNARLVRVSGQRVRIRASERRS